MEARIFLKGEKTMICPKCNREIPDNVKFCPECGETIAPKSSTVEVEPKKELTKTPFSTWKIVSGILCMVLFAFMMYQVRALTLFNALTGGSDTSGATGFLVGILILAAGIVSVTTRNKGVGANVILLLLYLIGALFAIDEGTSGGAYKDLVVWGIWCVVCAIITVVCIVKLYKQGKI